MSKRKSKASKKSSSNRAKLLQKSRQQKKETKKPEYKVEAAKIQEKVDQAVEKILVEEKIQEINNNLGNTEFFSQNKISAETKLINPFERVTVSLQDFVDLSEEESNSFEEIFDKLEIEDQPEKNESQ